LIKKEVKEIFEKLPFIGEVKFDEPMARHTSIGIGGPAEVMVFPEDVVSLKNLLITARERGILIFVIGSGTNLLIRDSGISGIAVSLKAMRIIRRIKETRIAVTLFAEAGVPLQELINFTKEHGYSGMEELAGIPGSLGGAIYMNAGSFGREVKDIVTSVSLMDMDGEIKILHKDELKFSYRASNIPQDLIILSANTLLKRDDPEDIGKRIKKFLKKRMDTQPLRERSAGCVFKNPQGDSAGRLIELAGCKGMRIGDVEVSNVHANFFINRQSATSEDFIKLMDTVRKKVKEHSGITLEPEIRII